MKNTVSYRFEIKDEYRCFYDTLSIYQEAVSFLIRVVDNNYEAIVHLENVNYKQRAVESLVHTTKGNTAKYKSFDKKFHKLPSYLRRSAINAAIGAVSGYRSDLGPWEKSDKKNKRPRLNVNRHVMPVFYKGAIRLSLHQTMKLNLSCLSIMIGNTDPLD